MVKAFVDDDMGQAGVHTTLAQRSGRTTWSQRDFRTYGTFNSYEYSCRHSRSLRFYSKDVNHINKLISLHNPVSGLKRGRGRAKALSHTFVPLATPTTRETN